MKKNILSRFTSHTKKSIDRARLIAINQGQEEITNVHLLYAIAFEKGSVGQNILKEMGFEKSSLINFNQDFDTAKNIPFSNKLKETLRQATKIASRYHYPYIGTEHLIYAMLESNDKEINLIINKAIDRKQINSPANQVPPLENSSNLGQMPDFLQSMNIHLVPRPKDASFQSPLDKFASNLNSENQKENTPPVIGRENETDRIINVLLRKNKNNPVLIGEPGVGKTAVVNALAQRINKGEVPAVMLDKTIWELDLGLLLSGTTFRGEFEQRIKEVIAFATKNESVILFIDEIHNLMGAGSAQGSLDAANMLKPALAKGEIKLIGATTFDEYRNHIEKDAALERRFQPININEPQIAETRKILNGIRKNYEKFHNVIIDKKAIDAAVNLSTRYINDRFLPDKAIDLIDEAQAKVKANAISFDMTKKIKRCNEQKKRIESLKDKLIYNDEFKVASGLKKDEKELDEIMNLITQEQNRREKLAFLRITEQDIKEVIARHTGVPVEEINMTSKKDLLNLNKKLANRIVGQPHAIKAVTTTLKRAMSGIHNPARPMGSFIFLGPTGVGKTYLAKTIAEQLFKNPASFHRIDMSEFSEKHNISRLVGAPAGYVGYEDGGKLTDRVRRNPYSLVLFDEIEKAHPEVFNILLQILEDGTLTDATGRNVNFKNTIIILTSNIGAKSFTEETIGFDKNDAPSAQNSKAETDAVYKLRDLLAPELLNRIDNIIAFKALNINDLNKIAKKEVEALNKRLREKNVKLNLDKKIYDYLAQKSSDKREGARLIRKNIEELIQSPIAEILLERENRRELNIKGKLAKEKIKLIAQNK